MNEESLFDTTISFTKISCGYKQFFSLTMTIPVSNNNINEEQINIITLDIISHP